ncbi:MAG: phage tail protein, partial [Hungatella sp.]
QAEMNNPTDKLLFEIKGRYLWFAISMQTGQEEAPQLQDLTFYFPRETWLKYLPEVYERNEESREFLERYLGIFQSIYEDMEREIRQDASLLDADATSDEFLTWLAGWLDIGNTYMWSRDKLRCLISRAADLFELRGTKRGLLEILTLYTGDEPLLVEEWQTREFRKSGSQKVEMERLYGREPNMFTLLLKEKYLSSSRDYQVILSLVKAYAPAYMEVRIVPIKPLLFLGEYTYLGINSGLGQYRPFKLDGLSVLPYTAIGGRIQEGEQQ